MKHLILPTWHWSKRLTMIVVIIPVLIFLGFVGAVSLIDFNQYKPQLEQEVTQYTGHEFKIAGSLEVSVFPFALSAGDVSLKNSPAIAARFERENILSVKQVRAELSVWSLLIHKQVAIKGLELIQPKLTLLRDEQGYNWKRLAQLAGLSEPFDQTLKQSLMSSWHHQAAVASAQDLTRFKQGLQFVNANDTPSINADNASQSSESNTINWHFDSVIIKQGTFEHQDLRIGQIGEVSELNLLAFDVTLGQPFQVRSDFTYKNALNHRQYYFDVSANVDVSDGFLSLKVSDWQGIFNLKLPDDQNVPTMRLVTEGQRFLLDLLNEQVEIEGLVLSSLGSRFESSFKGQYGLNPQLSGTFSATDVNARKWFYHLGLPLPGFVQKEALTSLNGAMKWQLSEHKWAFNEIDVKLDKTAIKGNVWQALEAQPQGAAMNQTYLFDLSVDQLNLNDYQANINDGFFPLLQTFKDPESVDIKASKKVSRPAKDETTEATYLPLAVPVSTLKALSADGQIKVNHLTYKEMVLESIEMTLTANQGQLQLAPFDAQLFKGALASKLTLNVNGETPAYNWYGQLENVALGSLLKAGWQTQPLGGLLNAHFKLKTLGSNTRVLTQNLQGELNATLAKGDFYGVDLQKLLTGQNSTAEDKTPYQNLVLKGLFDQGVYKAKQFSVTSKSFAANGYGSIDLNKASIDSQLQISVTELPASLSHLKGVLVPVSYGGPIENLRWTVNLQSLLKDPSNQAK